MKKELQLLARAKVVLLMLCPTTAWAATVAFGESMAAISIASVVATLVLSTVMGLAALLQAMIDEYQTKEHIPRIWLFVVNRMVSSNAAGLLAFAVLESYDIPIGYRAGAIMVAAFGGNWTLQRALQWAADKKLPKAPA